MDLDEADRVLLKALRADARLSYRELSRLSGVSTPTAAAKVRRLEALGIIRGYAARVDPLALGRTLHVVELHVLPAQARTAAEHLGGMPHVEEVLEMAGGLLHARLAIPPGTPLQEFLQGLAALDGIQSYRVHLVMTGLESAPDATDVPREVSVACHECKGPVRGQGIHKRWPEDGGHDHWFCCRNCSATLEARLRKRAEDAARPPGPVKAGARRATQDREEKRARGGPPPLPRKGSRREP